MSLGITSVTVRYDCSCLKLKLCFYEATTEDDIYCSVQNPRKTVFNSDVQYFLLTRFLVFCGTFVCCCIAYI